MAKQHTHTRHVGHLELELVLELDQNEKEQDQDQDQKDKTKTRTICARATRTPHETKERVKPMVSMCGDSRHQASIAQEHFLQHFIL